MGNSLLAVRDINHKYIVVDRRMTDEDEDSRKGRGVPPGKSVLHGC